jgi:hypothetical protein
MHCSASITPSVVALRIFFGIPRFECWRDGGTGERDGVEQSRSEQGRSGGECADHGRIAGRVCPGLV